MAVRSRANSCSRLIVGIVSSNPVEGHECSSNMFALCCAVSVPCDVLQRIPTECMCV
jgi:hypothetical protein